jgi:uncharacterized protein
MKITDEIKIFVEKECRKPTSKYGYEPFDNHFKIVVSYVESLNKEFGRDQEVLIIAAWLHDIGSIIVGRENHHETGVKIAEKKLKELKYPIDKIELVKKCILNHRGSQRRSRKNIEEKIIADADALANFDNISGIFKAALVYENKTQEEARKSVLEKLERKWNQLHFEESRKIIKPRYIAVKLLLDNKR